MTGYPTPFHILVHLSKLAATLEAGDRAGRKAGDEPRPAAHYTDRAYDLWDAAKSTLVRRGFDIPESLGDLDELARMQRAVGPYASGEPLGGG